HVGGDPAPLPEDRGGGRAEADELELREGLRGDAGAHRGVDVTKPPPRAVPKVRRRAENGSATDGAPDRPVTGPIDPICSAPSPHLPGRTELRAPTSSLGASAHRRNGRPRGPERVPATAHPDLSDDSQIPYIAVQFGRCRNGSSNQQPCSPSFRWQISHTTCSFKASAVQFF